MHKKIKWSKGGMIKRVRLYFITSLLTAFFAVGMSLFSPATPNYLLTSQTVSSHQQSILSSSLRGAIVDMGRRSNPALKNEIASLSEAKQGQLAMTSDEIASPQKVKTKAARNDGQIEYIPITDVRKDDFVLSLNEATGAIEPRRINGLLDMGVKPVFKLTTEDGRYIKTTGNQPYLTKDGWKKVVELKTGEKIAAGNIKLDMVVTDVFSVLTDSYSEKKQPHNHQYTQPNYSSESLHTNLLSGKLTVQPNSSGKKDDSKDNSEYFQSRMSFKDKISDNHRGNNQFRNIKESLGNIFSLSFTQLHVLNYYHIFNHLSRLFLENSAYANMEFRDILWDKIISIDYVGYEHVYDIEVEGTHNFVAGHWVEKQMEGGRWKEKKKVCHCEELSLTRCDEAIPLFPALWLDTSAGFRQ